MRYPLIWLSVLALCAASLPAVAQETGIHKMHATVTVGGKVCLASHEHYGEGPPGASAAAGYFQAKRKWEIFTAEEYGKSWGSYALAVGKKEKCTGVAPNMVCSVEARPCKLGR